MSADEKTPGRLGILSDVHGNLEALEAVLEALDEARVERIICCGDVVGYGASPNECVALLRAREIPTILGNHDAAVLSDAQISFFNEMARDAVLWTRNSLSPENLVWLHERPMTMTVGEAFFVHASPRDPPEWNYVLTYPEARIAFRHFRRRFCFIGHSHQPFFIALHGEDLIHLRASEVPIEDDTRYLVNVGSVGQPRDHDPRAACVIADFAEGRLSLIRVDYDIARAQEKIRLLSKHGELAERLAHGY
jgi:diadenosine tetraphosphatase ApaH/serine/threonine PP2A family protein phosphatase